MKLDVACEADAASKCCTLMTLSCTMCIDYPNFYRKPPKLNHLYLPANMMDSLSWKLNLTNTVSFAST